MVEPFIIGALAIGAANAIAQWQTSREARQATEEEHAKIADMYNKMQMPDFDPSWLTPEEYQVVAKYVPQAARYVEATAPQTVQASGVGAVRGREAQMAALDRLLQVGRGQDPYQQAVIQQAAQQASQAAEASRQAALQGMARRGIAGGGLELASALQGQAESFRRAGDLGLQAGMERYKQGLESLYQAGQLGGQIRGEDIGLEARNADIINQFNAAQTAYARGLAQQQADLANQAQMYNLGQAQKYADVNAQQRAAMKQAKLEKAQTDFANRMKLAGLRAGVSNVTVQDIMGRAQDTKEAMQGLANVGLGTVAMANPQRYNPVTGQPYFDPYTGKSLAIEPTETQVPGQETEAATMPFRQYSQNPFRSKSNVGF